MPTLVRPPKLRATDEQGISNEIRARLGMYPDLVLFRNAQSFAEVWDEKTGRTRHHHGGLGRGTADLVGILRMSNGIGRWISLEVKRPGQNPTEIQNTIAALVRRFGGFSAVVRSPEDAVSAIDRARVGACE